MIAVATCDIVKSAKYSRAERAQIQGHLLASWQEAQAKFGDRLDSDLGFRVTAGDEFQFVSRDVKTALECVTFLRIRMRLLKIRPLLTFRASIGLGERSVAGDANPYAQDGPAFHLARAGMEKLKSRHEPVTRILVEKNGRKLALVNAALAVSDVIYLGWTPAQAAVLALANEGLRGEEIASRLRIVSSAVSRRLSRSRWEIYHHVIQSVADNFR